MSKHTLVLFIILSVSRYSECFSQRYVESYISIQGTWDKVKDTKRARFAGNNLSLIKHFSDEYSSKFARHFIHRALRERITINTTAELVFIIKNNFVDSLQVVTSSGFAAVDSVIISILQSTSGKWIPGKSDGTILREVITMWVHIFCGDVKAIGGRSTSIREGDEYFQNREYKRQLKHMTKRFSMMN